MNIKKIKYLPDQIRKQIKFQKDDTFGLIFRYSCALIVSLGALYLGLLFNPSENKTIFYLLFILAVLLGIYLGGANAGLIVIVFGSICAYLFVNTAKFSGMAFIEAGLFALVGFLLIAIINKVRRINLIDEFNRKEKSYQTTIKRLEESKQKAEEEVKSREAFISIASHELKNPLTTTLLRLQDALYNIRNVSLADFSVQKLLDMLEGAEQQTQRLARMINDLLNVSIIRTGRLDLELEEANLTEIVKDVVKGFKERGEKEGFTIKTQLDEVIKTKIDKIRIAQVVINLLTNAVKYGENKPIEVKAYKDGPTAKIKVSDQGIGIPKKQQEKVFALFERAVPNNGYKGLGIGLYISNQIVKAHKGKIRVDSNEGKGSTFTVELPVE